MPRRNGSSHGTKPTPVLELRDVHAAYGKIEVLHGVDVTIPGGALVAVLGPNGAGKTTTLRVMSGLMHPTSGRMLLEGYDVTGVAPERLAEAGVCLIPEGRGIFPNLTVRENILMDTYVHKRPPREIEVLAAIGDGLSNKEAARRLGISQHTVKFHVESLFRKLDATSRAEAVHKGLRQGLIEL